MGIQLEISDGNPTWYLSTSIWPVPGSDFLGAPGIPMVGEATYLWARVTNTGDVPANGADVYFWWGDPSTVTTFGDLVPVGRSRVSLAAGETKDVLCLSQWVPVGVNGGHECLVALAYSSGQFLARPDPSDPLDAPADSRVAQRNLDLVLVGESRRIVFPFLVRNNDRESERLVRVLAHRQPVTAYEELAGQLGELWPSAELREDLVFGLALGADGGERTDPERGWQDDDFREISEQLELVLGPGQVQEILLGARVSADGEAGEGALVLVEQYDGDQLLGGCGLAMVL